MKVYSIGAGFVSSHLNYPCISDRLQLNIQQINNVLDTYRPDILINAIGKTGRPNIDFCETHKEETALTNTALPILLAEACNKKSIRLINLSSGCIFFGKSPTAYKDCGCNNDCFCESNIIDTGWNETDVANPQSFYSRTKYACDLVLGQMNNVCSLRIRMPISDKNSPRNIINKLRNYDKIINIPNSMTIMSDLVRCIDWVIAENKTGIYHITNPQPLTAAQIMWEYEKYRSDHFFRLINEWELNKLTTAKRSNCLLDTTKLQQEGFQMTNSIEALEETMKRYIQNIG